MILDCLKTKSMIRNDYFASGGIALVSYVNKLQIRSLFVVRKLKDIFTLRVHEEN